MQTTEPIRRASNGHGGHVTAAIGMHIKPRILNTPSVIVAGAANATGKSAHGVAKMDACVAQSFVPSGTYRLRRVEHGDVAKMAACTVEITLLSAIEVSPEFINSVIDAVMTEVTA